MPLIRKEPPAPPRPARPELKEAAAALRNGSAEERWNAARSLAGFPEAAGLLGEALAAEPEPRVREAILTSLSRLATPESVAAVIPYLRSDDAGLRGGALEALREMIAAARPRLPELLADPDPDVRLLCCDLARELPSAEATRLLCDLVERETEANVCGAAVDVLAEVGEPSALPVLARCEARFRTESFLPFAIRIAMERIAAQGGRP